MTTPNTSSWPSWITMDGNSLVFENVTITISNAFDPTTGIATLTITPAGGLGVFPVFAPGPPGPTPTFTIGTVTTLPPGSEASASLEQTSPGVIGGTVPLYQGGTATGNAVVPTSDNTTYDWYATPPSYQVNVAIPQGQPGNPAVNSILDAVDVISNPVEDIADGAVLLWNKAAQAFGFSKLAYTPTFTASSMNSTSGTAQGPRVLGQITVPAQLFAWMPDPSASVVVNGTANTEVNLFAYVDAVGGDVVGSAYGVAGVPNQTLTLASGTPPGSPGNYGQIAAGASATIILVAEQVASTMDPWSTSASTSTFSVKAVPVGLGEGQITGVA